MLRDKDLQGVGDSERVSKSWRLNAEGEDAEGGGGGHEA